MRIVRVFFVLTVLGSLLAVAPASHGQGVPGCQGLPATHVGTEGDDVIVGTDGIDVIVAKRGADIIKAKGGADIICAGKGADRVFGGDGSDSIHLGDGKDFANGGKKADEIHGQAGNDTIVGAEGQDRLWGDSGRDLMRGGQGDDEVRGGGKKDSLWGGDGDDVLLGDNGADFLTGGPGDADYGDGYADLDTCYTENPTNPLLRYRGVRCEPSILATDFTPANEAVCDATAWDTGDAQIDGRVYSYSIFCDAGNNGDTGFRTYDLERNYIHFKAQIGLDENESQPGSTYLFEVFGDGALLKSATLNSGEGDFIKANVRGVNKLKLVVTKTAGPGSSRAVWGSAVVSANPKTILFPSTPA